MRTSSTETFTSFLRLPQNFLSPPVLENVGSESIDPTQCLITRTNVDGIFALDLSKLSAEWPIKGMLSFLGGWVKKGRIIKQQKNEDALKVRYKEASERGRKYRRTLP